MSPRVLLQKESVASKAQSTKSADWINYREAMEFLGVSRSTLDAWRMSGRIVFSKLPNGQLRIRRYGLDQWLEELSEVWATPS